MTESSATTTASPPRRCAHCDAQLPDTPVSICPYCVMPIQGVAAAETVGGVSPNAERIERILQNEATPEALALTPAEGLDHRRAVQRMLFGQWFLMLAVGFGAATLLGGTLGIMAMVLAVAFAIAGVRYVAKGLAARRRALASPLVKRVALIRSRRSETELRGLSGSTTYYFEIEFEDNLVAEFRYPGRGAQEDPYTTNLPGVAYTRGQELLYFKHIRV